MLTIHFHTKPSHASKIRVKQTVKRLHTMHQLFGCKVKIIGLMERPANMIGRNKDNE